MTKSEELLSQLSLEEKCRLLGGATTWRTHPIERLGIPALKMSDGPNGLRGEGSGSRRTAGVALPVGISLGATWDPQLMAEVGDLLGREAVRKGAHVVLAPTINLQRTPIGGRVFEAMSEDPWLTARLAVPYIQGVQAHRVAVTAKHFVGNDTEVDRMSVDVRIDERVRRELYLLPFEAAVREGGAWGVMSAYNRLDGEFCAANHRLLSTILRDEWGFDGFVVSDWLGAHDTAPSARAGLTIPMPGPTTIYGESLRAAVDAGDVDESTVDALVRDVLRLIERTDAAQRPVDRPEETVDDPTDRALVRRTAVAGTVLLRNEGALLPIDATAVSSVAVIGPNASHTRIMGGGSSSLQSLPHRSLLDALTDRLGPTVTFEPGVRIDKMTPLLEPASMRDPDGVTGALRVEYRNGHDPTSPVAHRDDSPSSLLSFFGSTPAEVDIDRFAVRVAGSYVAAVDGPHAFGLVVTGPARLRLGGEIVVDDPDMSLPRGDAFFGFGSEEQLVTRDLRAGGAIEVEATMTAVMGFGVLRLGVRPPDPPDLLDRAVRAAAAADLAIVVAGTNEEWETEGHDRDAIALPGEQDELIRRVADANPRTVVVVNAGSPVSMPWIEAVPSVVTAYFGGTEMGDALVDVLVGDVDPGGRLPISYPRRLEDTPAWVHYPPSGGTQTYGEGFAMGYRGFEMTGVEPLYPFGHGLSYGDIDWGTAEADAARIDVGASVTVRVPLVNRADRAGTAVVQVYVAPVDPPVTRPPKELRGWAKVGLGPGEQEEASIELGPEAFRRWDTDQGAWTIDPGVYELVVAASAADERQRLPLEITPRPPTNLSQKPAL